LHPFVVGAQLKIDPNIPGEAERIVREVPSEKQFNRRGFRWSSFFAYLVRPSLARHEELKVDLVTPDQIALVVPGHKPWVFVSKDAAGKWSKTDDAN
jgi:hypothetical protein